ncbi:MAG: hypothetical protein JSU91_04735 [Thermoplasmatales archaeon]|nr:MAG: hypothetical protein JSU91_04735 [Thermoplasmatales archaeon]
MRRNPVLYKVLVILVIVLIFGMSVVSSTNKIVDGIPSYTQILDSEESSEESFRGNYGYAYYAYPGPECTVYFTLDDLGTLYECGETISGDFLLGGAIDGNGIWYASKYGSGIIYGIDTNNGCYMWPIGGGGIGLYDLAWDDCTSTLYGTSGYDFYEIDSEDGGQAFIGSSDILFKGIAFNSNCICYGVGYNGSTHNLYIINFSSFDVTFVAPLTNISSFYFCSLEFDKDYDVLYLLLFGTDFYTCDTDTGVCTNVYGDGFEGGADLTAFVIPYDTTPPVTNISLKGNMSEFGIYTGDVEVTLNATDDLLGVNVTYYRISNGELKTYVEPFIVSGHGEHCLTYWSVDNAGNKEDTNFAYIKIDLVPPTIRLMCIKLDNNSYEIDPFVSESGSGFYKLEYYVDNIHMCTKYWNQFKWIWTPSHWGFYMLSGILYDKAGHTGYDEVEVFVPRYRTDTNLWYQYLLERFPLLEVFLRIMNL